MYAPVILSGALVVGGLSGVFSRRAARTVFASHLGDHAGRLRRGLLSTCVALSAEPGGWRLPIVNMIMGPPVFAPLLFGVSAYLGLLASFLRRGDLSGRHLLPQPTHPEHWAASLTGGHERISWEQDVREGRFQKQMAAATVLSAFLSGAEAWYSHYKNNFRYKAQWTPVVVAPM